MRGTWNSAQCGYSGNYLNDWPHQFFPKIINKATFVGDAGAKQIDRDHHGDAPLDASKFSKVQVSISIHGSFAAWLRYCIWQVKELAMGMVDYRWKFSAMGFFKAVCNFWALIVIIIVVTHI